MSCDISEERLWAWVHDENDDPAENAEIALHVADCDECRAAVAQMRALVSDLVGSGESQNASTDPRVIGDYEIVRRIGQGGMGVVFEARQQNPRRAVALKVIRGGQWVDEHQVRMFQREIATLARLRHSGIAAIYEAGQTADGAHHLVMELVRGVPLDHYLREPHAPDGKAELELRLELFRQIAEAISYAHQRGVIHRDLKPGNILVEQDDGEPTSRNGVESATDARVTGFRTKVLDFGLARILDEDENEPGKSMMTRTGQVMGTPAYMSPEQAAGRTDAIDVRTDIYTLGVILYEMLTGTLPHEIQNAPMHEIARRICDEPPVAPSRAVRGEVLKETHRAIRIDSDLDTIVLKALEKEPVRRYSSVALLLEDLRRFRAGEPILARPASTTYQLRKWVSRHRGPVLVASVAAVMLVGTITVGLVRIEGERQRVLRQALVNARIQNFFNKYVFGAADWWRGGQGDITVADVLDSLPQQVEAEFGDDDEVAAAAWNMLGKTLVSARRYESGESCLQKALQIRRAAVKQGADHSGANLLALADTLNALGELAMRQNLSQRAEPLLAEAKQIRETTRQASRSERAESLNNWGYLLKQRGDKSGSTSDYASAEATFTQALSLRKAVLLEVQSDATRTPQDRLVAINDVAQTLNNLAALSRAVAATLRNSGDAAGADGRMDVALQLYREALELRVAALGEDHPDVGKMHNNIGRFLEDRGDLEGALASYEKARQILESRLTDGHEFTAGVLRRCAEVLLKLDRPAEALERCNAAIAMQQKLGLSGNDAAELEEVRQRIAARMEPLRQLQAGGE